MITIVVGTNRKSCMSLMIARVYKDLLDKASIENQILELSSIPNDAIQDSMYADHDERVKEIYTSYIDKADKFIFVIPEYNGSFPGILKMFIDMTPPSLFENKKAALIGLSSGRAGNLRGTDQFTGILNYLKVNVHYSKLKISGIEGLCNEEGQLENEYTLGLLSEHVQTFIEF